MKQTILIGDSIRMGYQATVIELLPEAEIWVPDANGGNSANVLANLEDWVEARQPDIVHLNCGLHDIKREFGADKCAIPLIDYEANLRQIFARILGTGATLIWATTTPCNQAWHHANKGFDRLDDDLAAYNATARRVAEQFELPIDDLHAGVMEAGRDGILVPDGVHFTPEGYRLLGTLVADFLRPYAAA